MIEKEKKLVLSLQERILKKKKLQKSTINNLKEINQTARETVLVNIKNNKRQLAENRAKLNNKYQSIDFRNQQTQEKQLRKVTLKAERHKL